MYELDIVYYWISRPESTMIIIDTDRSANHVLIEDGILFVREKYIRKLKINNIKGHRVANSINNSSRLQFNSISRLTY